MKNDEKIVVYKSFNSSEEAYIIKGLLSENEIPCFLSDENTIGVNPFYSIALGGIKINIFERDRERVDKLLSQNNSLQIEEEKPENGNATNETHCPKCGSTNVYRGRTIENKANWFVIFISMLLATFPFFITKKKYHCFKCGGNFNVKS